jgi:hypothetical protein
MVDRKVPAVRKGMIKYQDWVQRAIVPGLTKFNIPPRLTEPGNGDLDEFYSCDKCCL